jgi:cysteine desulfurase/selenocysteine lyase
MSNSFQTRTIKQDFPIFKNQPNLVYLDSAATTLKPASVIAKSVEYYEQYSANVARGLYELSERATREYEKTREMTARFINAFHKEEVIFTRGTTESVNLLAYSLESQLHEGDEILIPVAEHHSNSLPWQALAERKKAFLKVLEIHEDGSFKREMLSQLITPKTKIFAFGSISNVLGIINPVKEIIAQAKQFNPHVLTIVDAAQAVAHIPIDVQDLGCDFLAFSSHKMFGPTGVGVLWGKFEHLNSMPPFHYGGEMVIEAHIDAQASLFKAPPHKFEAGTPNIAGVIAFQEALKYIQSLGFEAIRVHEAEILQYALEKLKQAFREKITFFGSQNVSQKSGVISFSIAGIHPHDIAQFLAEDSICIRAGAHCAQPLHDIFKLPATARLSVSVYTDTHDIDLFVDKLAKVQALLKK